jgi:transcriptional regulator with XRE-family HTH domain
MEKQITAQSIRDLRVQSSITLRELSRMTGVSAAYIVSIEKGASSPTIATLAKILKALGTDLATFFTKASNEPEKPVFSAKEMKDVRDEYRHNIFLLPKRSDLHFEMVDETIFPNEKNTEWEIHDCDVGGVIISGGPAMLEIESYGQWKLCKGDSFYIKAKKKHRLINKGKNKLRQITIMDPARY